MSSNTFYLATVGVKRPSLESPVYLANCVVDTVPIMQHYRSEGLGDDWNGEFTVYRVTIPKTVLVSTESGPIGNVFRLDDLDRMKLINHGRWRVKDGVMNRLS